MRSSLFLAMMLAASSLAEAETPLTIEQLLAQGWEIAGYASGYDNRTSLILFRHPGQLLHRVLRLDARCVEPVGISAGVGPPPAPLPTGIRVVASGEPHVQARLRR